MDIFMTKKSERIPVAEDYLRALGRATYDFACLEWGIIWLTETLQTVLLKKASTMTAGQIADCFSNVVEILDDTDSDKKRLLAIASDFAQIVTERNRLMHGHPHTTETGEQRLLYNGKHGRKEWTIDLMTSFPERAATASIKAGGVLNNGRLQQYYATIMPPNPKRPFK